MSIPSSVVARRLPSDQPLPALDFPMQPTSGHAHIASREPLRPVSPPSAAIFGIQIRVLIADEAGAAQQLAHLLRGLGYSLTKTASCGASALALARDFSPSIVLIALDLPDMSARYIGRRVRERAITGQVRLIALAHDHSLASRDRVCQSGFLRYLTKPVSAAALEQALRTSAS